jgi:cation transport ATPase
VVLFFFEKELFEVENNVYISGQKCKKMSSRKRRKLKRVALVCGIFATIYFLGFFLIQMFDLNALLPEDWMSQDIHYIIACLAVVCFLLYSTIVIRIYTRQSIPNPKFTIYMIFGIAISIFFVLWAVSLLMLLLKIA